ncbi:MAG: hypothetical protein J5515_07545, partial [Lachnospiraceae bacterium]|nr:hypothetical protein [Lachnospiraceae bacterium]
NNNNNNNNNQNNNSNNNNNQNTTPAHTHSFTQKSTDSKYLKSAATCTEAAVYYYSCECGEKDTSKIFTSGSALGHDWDKGTVIKEATLTDKGLITYKCIRSGCNETKTEEIPCILASSKAGDIIKFGKYEQDGNTSNGKEDIEWLVLSNEDGRVLVISKYALDAKVYNTEYVSVTWENCTLRSWLNNEFLNSAFDDKEKKIIPSVTLENKDNPINGRSGGNNTTDKVFCLSLDEIEKYFGEYNWYNENTMHGLNQKLICAPTQYAINNGVEFHDITDSEYNKIIKYNYSNDAIGSRGCWWWVRTPAYDSYRTCIVSPVGDSGADSSYAVNYSVSAVRPAIYLSY